MMPIKLIVPPSYLKMDSWKILPAMLVTESSSKSSRSKHSCIVSPGSCFPPGNSQNPERVTEGERLPNKIDLPLITMAAETFFIEENNKGKLLVFLELSFGNYFLRLNLLPRFYKC